MESGHFVHDFTKREYFSQYSLSMNGLDIYVYMYIHIHIYVYIIIYIRGNQSKQVSNSPDESSNGNEDNCQHESLHSTQRDMKTNAPRS